MKGINKSRLYMIVSICILCISILGGSLAYYRLVLFDDLTANTITNGLDYYINYSKGQNISGVVLEPTSDYTTSDANTSIILNKRDNTYDIYGHIYLDVNQIGSNLSTVSGLRYTLTNGDNVIAHGTLKGSKANDSVLVRANIPLEITEQSYTIYIWLDENSGLNPSMENETLSLTVRCEATMIPIDESIKAVDFISDLYKYTPKTQVTNNNIKYNYAPPVSLMNDRLGGTTSNYDSGNIRYYGEDPNNYVDLGDVYEEETTGYGWEIIGLYYDDQEDCYDDWNCEVYWEDWNFESLEQCEEVILGEYLEEDTGFSTVDELCSIKTIPKGTPKSLYRIIGLFKGVELENGTKKDLIKVISDKNIGGYSWDTSSLDVNNGYGINEWSQADLMKLLNPGYENNIDTYCTNNGAYRCYDNQFVNNSLWWNSSEGYVYTSAENHANYSYFRDIYPRGLSSNIHNKIATTVWNLGGIGWVEEFLYADMAYEYERGTDVVIPGITCHDDVCNDTVARTTSWTGKVALMYPSDYGYATDFNICSGDIYRYNEGGCPGNDWLYTGDFKWMLTPFSSLAHYAWIVDGGGVVYANLVSDSFAVFPVFYLDSELVIESGDGSKEKPYVIR